MHVKCVAASLVNTPMLVKIPSVHILCQHIFGLFWTHPFTKSAKIQHWMSAKRPFLNPPSPYADVIYGWSLRYHLSSSCIVCVQKKRERFYEPAKVQKKKQKMIVLLLQSGSSVPSNTIKYKERQAVVFVPHWIVSW